VDSSRIPDVDGPVLVWLADTANWAASRFLRCFRSMLLLNAFPVITAKAWRAPNQE